MKVRDVIRFGAFLALGGLYDAIARLSGFEGQTHLENLVTASLATLLWAIREERND